VSGVVGSLLIASCFIGSRFSVLYAANTGVALISIYLIYSLVNGSKVLSALVDFKYLRYLGRISYGFYLYHFLIGIALYPIVHDYGVMAYFVCSFVLTVVAASVSFHFFESPAKDYLVSAYKRSAKSVGVS
jgi:peptidoglycan/LPS O-acetylase OafA/YrhL